MKFIAPLSSEEVVNVLNSFASESLIFPHTAVEVVAEAESAGKFSVMRRWNILRGAEKSTSLEFAGTYTGASERETYIEVHLQLGHITVVAIVFAGLVLYQWAGGNLSRAVYVVIAIYGLLALLDVYELYRVIQSLKTGTPRWRR